MDAPIATPGVAEEVRTASVAASSVLGAPAADSELAGAGPSAEILTVVSAGGVTFAFLRFLRRPKL